MVKSVPRMFEELFIVIWGNDSRKRKRKLEQLWSLRFPRGRGLLLRSRTPECGRHNHGNGSPLPSCLYDEPSEFAPDPQNGGHIELSPLKCLLSYGERKSTKREIK